MLALGGVQLEAAVVQMFLKAFEEDLRSFVGAAGGPTVEVQGRHVDWAVVGFGLDSATKKIKHRTENTNERWPGHASENWIFQDRYACNIDPSVFS